ncbi:hypothetical protein, partial [Klebsiella variicola]|uniref:hypothetical protein n=1 Tax=Klebsiella variicola TaxID=244366 RepID=UPI00273171E9
LDPIIRLFYAHLATKGGSTPSHMTGVWYAKPRGQDPIMLAVFYRDLPMDTWLSWIETFTHQEVEQRAVVGIEGCSVFDLPMP